MFISYLGLHVSTLLFIIIIFLLPKNMTATFTLVTGQISQGKFQQFIWKKMSIHYAAAPFIKRMTFQSAHFLQFRYFAI